MRMTSNQVWVLALTSSGSFMIALDSTVVTTALSTIRRDLGAPVPVPERSAGTAPDAILSKAGGSPHDKRAVTS